MKLHRYVDHQRLHIVTKDVISLSISVLLLFRHYISHKITFGAPSSGGVLRSACGAFIIQRIRNNHNLFLANRYYSISCIKDKSIATCADVNRLLLMFENLGLTLAKKRCEWECNKTIISENFCVFPFVKTSGYHLKVFVFKLNQIHICQTTIVENAYVDITSE